MTREDLKRQVLAEFSGMAETVLGDWLKGYREIFDFGPTAVLSAERQLRRELNYAQRKTSIALRAASLKRP